MTGGNYLDFDIDRREAARYGLTVGDIQDVIQSAVGGMNITTTVEGLERYPVNLRYGRELRDDIPGLRRILIPDPHRGANTGSAGSGYKDKERPPGDQERKCEIKRMGICGY